MPRREAVEDAVRTAATGAQVDPAAADGEQIRFPRGALDAVVRLYRGNGSEDLVISAHRKVLREFIDAAAAAGQGTPEAARHMDAARALLALQERLQGAGRVQHRVGVDGEIERLGREGDDPLTDPWIWT